MFRVVGLIIYLDGQISNNLRERGIRWYYQLMTRMLKKFFDDNGRFIEPFFPLQRLGGRLGREQQTFFCSAFFSWKLSWCFLLHFFFPPQYKLVGGVYQKKKINYYNLKNDSNENLLISIQFFLKKSFFPLDKYRIL